MELKPCPFCGNKNVSGTQHLNPNNYEILCMNCFARMRRSAKRKAIEAWNRRATDESNNVKYTP